MQKTLIIVMLSTIGLASGCAQPPAPTPADVPQLVLMDRGQLVLSDMPWQYHDMPGRQIRTPHYRIFTTHTDPEVIERLPQFLETAFLHYQSTLSASQTPSGPMDVYLFGERSQWDSFTREFTDERSAQVYLRIQEGGYVDHGTAVFYDIHRLKTFAVTGHEGFHQYVAHFCQYRLPAWLDEGLACYFEGFLWDGNVLRFQPTRNLLRLRALRYGLTRRTNLPLAELLSTHPGKIIGERAGTVSSYYAQLWALVQFLREGPYREGFARMLADAGTRRMLQQAAAAGWSGQSDDFGPSLFRRYISTDVAGVEKEFQDYCLKLARF
ncbi:MAG: hypothetical protein BIFFINMI_02676 [Phycisphaerae bacterium]|nr:hypothetical protein [Phycisphaerae bacterium]